MVLIPLDTFNGNRSMDARARAYCIEEMMMLDDDVDNNLQIKLFSSEPFDGRKIRPKKTRRTNTHERESLPAPELSITVEGLNDPKHYL